MGGRLPKEAAAVAALVQMGGRASSREIAVRINVVPREVRLLLRGRARLERGRRPAWVLLD